MSNNFGDNLNYEIIKGISGGEPVYAENREEEHHIVCGSIITESNENSIICGAGFANYHDTIDSDKCKAIHSVRGELTRERLGLSEETPVGDPALLMPFFYIPKPVLGEQKREMGVIPHWKDVELLMETYPDYYIINPLKPAKEVIDDILSCKKIISSSLHGLILADAYHVPNMFIKTGIDIGGDGFKFDDYYSTTDIPKLPNETKFFVSRYKHDLNKLLKSFPFYYERYSNC